MSETADPLLTKMVNRLTRAIANAQMRKQMDLEDEIEREYQNLEGQVNAQKMIVQNKNRH